MDDTQLSSLLDEYDIAKEQKDAADAKIEAIKSNIKMLTGDRMRIRTNTHSISTVTFSKNNLDTEALKENEPELYAQYSKKTNVSFQKIMRIKNDTNTQS